MSKRTFNLTSGWIVILLAAVGVWISIHRNTQTAAADREATFSRQNERMVRPSREVEADPVKKTRLTHEDVMGMKSSQWAERFRGMHRNVAAEISEEIVILAGELQSELEAGLDPQGEDAKAYSETMLTLLSEGALDVAQ